MSRKKFKFRTKWEKSHKGKQYEMSVLAILKELQEKGIVKSIHYQKHFGRRRPDFVVELPYIAVNLDGTLRKTANRLFTIIECKHWEKASVREYGLNALEQARDSRNQVALTLSRDVVTFETIIYSPIPSNYWPKTEFSNNLIFTNSLPYTLLKIIKDYTKRPGDPDYEYQSILDSYVMNKNQQICGHRDRKGEVCSCDFGKVVVGSNCYECGHPHATFN